MAVSKRTRYEVLRRDNHTCRYCGGTAPDAVLTVDHVLPVSLGGTDKPDNLVAACRDCNYGKAASNPDAPLLDNVREDALRWAAAVRRAAEIQEAERAKGRDYVCAVLNAWEHWGEFASLPVDFDHSVLCFYRAGLPVESVVDAVEIAVFTRGVLNKFNYFCGVCWRRVQELQEIAHGLIQTEDEDA